VRNYFREYVVNRCSLSDQPAPREVKSLPFGGGIWAWTGNLLDCFRDSPYLTESAYRSLRSDFTKDISKLSAAPLATELGLYRLRGALKGSTAEERYDYFVQENLLNHQHLLFSEYTELENTINQLIFFWIQNVHEFLDHLENDFPLLQERLGRGRPLGAISELAMNMGDSHQNGKRVILCSFEGGQKCVYKPKDIRISAAFQDLLEKINALSLFLPLRNYQVLARKEYGWEEYVSEKTCKTPEEVENYFFRGGMLLCLYYLLGGTDLHNENIIPAGDSPYIIDNEALFHAHIPTLKGLRWPKANITTILSTGLLPTFAHGLTKMDRTDVSGLGARQGQISPYPFLVWQDIDTDRIQQVYAYKEYSVKQVSLNKKAVLPENYVAQIVNGFKSIYNLVDANKDTFRDWIDTFANYPVRCIVKTTGFYSLLQEKLFSPSSFLNSVERKKILSHLHHYLEVSLRNTPFNLDPILEEEEKALLVGDIPWFHTHPKQKDLYCGKTPLIRDFLPRTALDCVHERLQKWGEKDCSLQERLIRGSFLIKERAVHAPNFLVPPKTGEDIDSKKLLEVVEAIAAHVKDSAILHKDGSCDWIALRADDSTDQYSLQPLTIDLYSGKMGIALFFAALASCGHGKWEEVALCTMEDIRQTLQNSPLQLFEELGVGGMTGASGLAYGLLTIGKLLKMPTLVEESAQFLSSLTIEVLQGDKNYDVIRGTAGLILVLLASYSYKKDLRLLELAIRAGDHLCSQAILKKPGKAWDNPDHSQSLLGFSHGTAGCAFALLRLFEHAPNPSYRETALEALAYERNHFSPEMQNWPHFGSEDKVRNSVAWCHGAGGVGLSRLALRGALADDPILEEEIQIALSAVQKASESQFICDLCCGTLGHIEFLCEAHKIYTGQGLQLSAERLVAQVVEHTQKNFGSDYDAIADISLMKGKVGVGYTLLRYLYPGSQLPQILLLT